MGAVIKNQAHGPHFFGFTLCLLITMAGLALLGMGMNSLVIKDIIFRAADNSEPMVQVNAPYMRLTNAAQEVSIHLYYRGYGNTALRLTPRSCFIRGFKLNGIDHTPPGQQNQWCKPFVADLGEWLQPGDNTLELSIIQVKPLWKLSPIIGLAVGSPLFGYHMPQSCFSALFLGCLLGLFWLLLARQGFDGLTCLIFIAACGTYLQWLHALPPFSHTLDWEKHASYIQFLSDHFFHPYDYNGPERAQPPLYYWTSALLIKILEFSGVFDVWTGLHLLSFLFYCVFLYFGMRSVIFLLRGSARYLALFLLAFWPAGTSNAAWIYNDAMLYPLYAACFYYTLVWFETNNSGALAKALISCGLAFMVKPSAVVPASILGTTVLFKLWRGRCRLSDLINRETRTGWCAAVAGVLFNLCGILYRVFTFRTSSTHALWGGDGNYNPSPQNLLYLDFHDFLISPYLDTWHEPSMLNLLIKSQLFNEHHWQHSFMASYMEMLYLVMLSYMIIFVFTLPKSRCASLFPLLAGFILPVAASVTFMLRGRYNSAMDFRYIYPAVIGLILVFTLAVQEAKLKDRPVLYYLGNAVAIAFALCSIVFFQMQNIDS